MSELLTVILAAGKGTRMKSDKIKVLHKVAGKAMLKHVISALDSLKTEIVCVVGHQKDEVKNEVNGSSINYVVQNKQLGTGHAVKQAESYIEKHSGPVVVLYGDIPLLRSETVQLFIEEHKNSYSDLTIMTAELDDPAGYGRIVKNSSNMVKEVVEEDDADFETRKITEINSGVYCFDSELLADFLKNMNNNNAQGEYYLTDAVEYASQKNKKIITYKIDDPEEILGVNTRFHLVRAEKILRKRTIEKHMDNGVTIIDPDNTYIDSEVEIGKDTIVYPFTYLEGSTKIGKNSIIGPHSRLVSAKIGENVELLSHSIIKESSVDDNTKVGPFAYLRPGCRIGSGCKVGDFVEMKKAVVGDTSKVPHLSYVGDAEIGERCNIGAGTIFANYDGKNKHKTKVEDDAFIGSNSVLVAPLKIGSGAKTGAGSVVTKDVEADTTVIGVPARVYKKKQD
ncbi:MULTISPECIES: bifunctional UDP-N-acetylglucosamine diphosphorylase/glucosamine-1-phosphate N-acetyltransferase GlmU [unclassified Halanaerobium]|uniref:bifunctional UDP-N-acetylglucosamine diphosphorylase/glucosamine-1-phosphate N-acetyltransferase GlmU n=1 Tax=unclassified Halanaerobium TaxID=2641197 RepID=UPI000DF245D2|nr:MULTISPECIES: bifunctional UDP-N-acetylglucosamine diphosphorylase/glucosamine-1-phosphate N-acetyltransferase GlmU [unclassified Halanaerobium]RCW40871.1 UDP-N-acetylglucosamine pyrophosphorylase /glucosamine-1-phosphate N-acetyltransferase [Halanaerobium sp. MA284_MarDTE_T2]RCW79072.1 UDP-N-acetylglucosamine pyrophosphorylase /glucosamine-1-phosphate N-acetyltransferase [Halanaerobium sp. DL-01]